MLNEQRDPTQLEQVIENTEPVETLPVEMEGLKVYDRPERPVVPPWAWLLILLIGALLAWVAIQALQ